MITFIIAIDEEFVGMSKGMLNSIRFYHPDDHILILTNLESHLRVKKLEKEYSNTRVKVLPSHSFDSLDWSSIVFSKIEVFNLDIDGVLVFLDVDQIMYSNVNSFVQEFVNSGFVLAATYDDEVFRDQFKTIPSGYESYSADKALNTGAFITKRNPYIYDKLVESAVQLNGMARLPTQAIFNKLNKDLDNFWLELDQDFMCHPFSLNVMKAAKNSCLVHFWTPRPAFFEFNKPRKGEKSYEELKNIFESSNLPEKI